MDSDSLLTVQEKATQTESVEASHKEVQTIYEKEFLNSKIENMILRNKMKTAEEKKDDSNLSTPDTNLSLNSLKDNDSKMKLFTGLTYYQFLALFNFLGESVNDLTYWDGNDDKESSKKGTRKLTPKEELFLTLTRLRRG